jgi:hypothetical protein
MKMSVLALIVFAGCSRSEAEVAAESPEFEAQWSQIVGAGARVQHVGGDDAELSGALGASATDGVSGVLQSALPAGGPLTSIEVDRAMRGRLSAVRMCQAQASRRGAMPSGKVIVRFQVATDGSVQNVAVDGPRFSSTPLLGCLATAVRRLTFRTSTGQPYAAAYPFIFQGS